MYLSLAVLLSGCTEETADEATTETAVKADATPEQTAVVEEYEALIADEKADVVIFKFNNDFTKEQTLTANNEIKAVYSKAVLESFEKDMDLFFANYGKITDFNALTDEAYRKIMDEKKATIARYKEELVTMIEQEQYQEAASLKIRDLAKEDAELNAIFHYADALYEISVGGSSPSIYFNVPPEYMGKYDTEINNLVSLSEGEWRKQYNDFNHIKNYEAGLIPLTLGLTTEEVLYETAWGKPERVNKTESAFETREQWVYHDYNYLYFEDGYLVSISTSY